MLAILKAGGAYVPLDPFYPDDRLRRLVDTAGIDLVVTNDAATDRFGPLVDAVAVDGRGPDAPPARPSGDVTPDDLAYVIFTSGSTGTPKGVMIEHGGVVNHLLALVEDYGLGPDDTVLQLPSLSFHPSVRDILGTLTAGARLVLLDDESARDPLRIMEAVARHRVTCLLSLVPSLLRAVLADARRARRAGRWPTAGPHLRRGLARRRRPADRRTLRRHRREPVRPHRDDHGVCQAHRHPGRRRVRHRARRAGPNGVRCSTSWVRTANRGRTGRPVSCMSGARASPAATSAGRWRPTCGSGRTGSAPIRPAGFIEPVTGSGAGPMAFWSSSAGSTTR